MTVRELIALLLADGSPGVLDAQVCIQSDGYKFSLHATTSKGIDADEYMRYLCLHENKHDLTVMGDRKVDWRD